MALALSLVMTLVIGIRQVTRGIVNCSEFTGGSSAHVVESTTTTTTSTSSSSSGTVVVVSLYFKRVTH